MGRTVFGSVPTRSWRKWQPSPSTSTAICTPQDIAASRAHAATLAAQGILTANDAKNIAKGLDTILSEIGKGSFDFKRALEDIHMHVEARLNELIGPAAGRLDTARSRNDQVATDLRLCVRETSDPTDAALAALQSALMQRAQEHADTVMPGFTDLETAQPVTFGHHLLAYVEMVGRDRVRFSGRAQAAERVAAGSGGAGRHLVPDRPRDTAKALGFDGRWPIRSTPCRTATSRWNCCAGGDRRDASVALCRGNHGLASPLFGLVRFSDAFTTGTSIMPQKPPRCRRTGARQDRPRGRRSGGAVDRDEGVAAGLS